MLYEINRHYYQRSLFPVCDPKERSSIRGSILWDTLQFSLLVNLLRPSRGPTIGPAPAGKERTKEESPALRVSAPGVRRDGAKPKPNLSRLRLRMQMQRR